MSAAMITLLAAACNREPEPEPGLTDAELRDPQACAECHPDHVREWSGSMHAYASEDPVFRAMEALGQQQTGGELGDFCVKCHAPAAVALGEVAQGSDLDAVDPSLRGVTCWSCHQVDGLDADGDGREHNNPLSLAQDHTMRGPISDPVKTHAHDSKYAPTHDRADPLSSALCGSCHDIVNPLGTHIERTYAEWKGSLFAKPGVFALNCGGCHMTGRDGVAAEADGVQLRRVHDHSMPGIDLALTPFPEAEAQRALVQDFAEDTVNAYLCAGPPGPTTLAVVTLENLNAGHGFPSGATADRRAWVEIVASKGGQVIGSSGSFALGEAPGLATDEDDPDLWRMWSEFTDANGAGTHHFWDAAAITDLDLLPAPTTLDPTDPAFVNTHVTRQYLFRDGPPDRIEMVVHVEPLGREILDELVDEGLLDPAVRDAMPRLTLEPTRLVWTPEVPVNSGDLACVPQPPVTVTATTP
jgi:hypothetical protein